MCVTIVTIISMYKYLIIGVTFLLLGAAGYYFNTSRGGDMLVQAVSTDSSFQKGIKLSDLFSGTYECKEDDGCEVDTYLTLGEGSDFKLYTYTDGTEELFSEGSWGVTQGNTLILFIEKEATSTQEISKSFMAQIDTYRIKSFSKKKKLYSWMKEPVFSRISS